MNEKVVDRYKDKADILSLPLSYPIWNNPEIVESITACAQMLRSLHRWNEILVIGHEPSGVAAAHQVFSQTFRGLVAVDSERLRTERLAPKEPVHFLAACSDFRYQHALQSYVEGYVGERTCVLQTPSPVKRFVEHRTRPIMLQLLNYMASRCSLTSFSLFNHLDCGGFGGSSSFEGREVEEETNRHFLLGAQRLIEEHVPECIFRMSDIFDTPYAAYAPRAEIAQAP